MPFYDENKLHSPSQGDSNPLIWTPNFGFEEFRLINAMGVL
jgi:hypothetical protein